MPIGRLLGMYLMLEEYVLRFRLGDGFERHVRHHVTIRKYCGSRDFHVLLCGIYGDIEQIIMLLTRNRGTTISPIHHDTFAAYQLTVV
jgi:hypothetical protein